MVQKQFSLGQADDKSRIHLSLTALYMKNKRSDTQAPSPSKSFNGKDIPHALGYILGKKGKKRGSERESKWSGMEFPSSPSFGFAASLPNKKKEDQSAATSPQVYLDDMLKSLGYPTRRYSTLESGYHAKPTPLQTASYDSYIIRLAREGENKDALKEIVESGVSPNPCNRHGESLVHMVCGSSDSKTLQILLDAGASIKVSDDSGRTPLHYACGRKVPCFGIIEKIAREDLQLFYMEDRHGALPLSYVPRKQRKQWVRFLECKKKLFQTLAGQHYNNTKEEAQLADMPPNMFPMKDPRNSLPLELAFLVAAGKVSPTDAKILHMDAELSDCTEESGASLSESDDDDISFSFGTECDFTGEDYERIMSFDPIGIGV